METKDRENEGKDWLEPLDHTADAGFRVCAPDLDRLFTRVAWAMFDLICDLDTVGETQEINLSLEAPDLPGLLVTWLTELNYRHVTEKLLFREFEVRVGGQTPFRCEGTAAGETIRPGKHTVFTEIKAVTYHGLEVKETEDGWVAQVIFDV